MSATKMVVAALSVLALVAPAKADTLRLMFVGDIMLDDGPGKTIAAGGDPLAEFDALLRGADFTIGNLECPVATTGKALDNKPWTFRADPSVMRVLKGRFDALGVSNNHSGDYGREAFVETLKHVRAADIASFGGGANLVEAHAPLWIEQKGLRIAVLAYNEFKPRSFEAGAKWPGIAWSEDSQVVADIKNARKAGADLVIPFMHWGWEHEREPGPRQVELAHRMIDAGADVVVGGHPHVTQGASLYRGKPIIWSLGNFVFDGFNTVASTTGWVLRLDLDRQGASAFSVVVAHQDEAGTAHLSKDAAPCWRRGEREVSLSCGPAKP
ncbi:CapA family protein [Niveibacterium sp.]|uniref:CapA family protein n=1 Tax=Niveibacterium sp. TaxID=2017444 RepID=UPI0035B32CDF